jgi:hypothetical protein
MDSQDRDESKIRRREETLARRVGEALDRMDPHGAEECPDAEIIAAYAEQTLEPGESGRWEGHFATCARCRKILRVLAASADTPLAEKEVAQLGELVSAVRAPVEITGRAAGRVRPKLLNWRARWLAPAIGVAAVLAVWFSMRPPWRVTGRGASESLVAQAPKEEVPLSPAPAEADRLSRVAPQQDQKSKPASPPESHSANAQSLNSPVEGLGKGRVEVRNGLDSISPSAGGATSSLQQEKKLSAPPVGREIQPPAIPPPQPPLPKAQAAMEAPAAPQSKAKVASNAAVAGNPQVETNRNASGNVRQRDDQAATPQFDAGATTGGAVNEKTSPETRTGPRKEQSFAVLRSTQKYSPLLKAPSGAALWRAGKGGIIERSTDVGKTWASQMSPSPEDWLAGAVVSDTVCWLAGTNGAIARTVDGVHWERVSPPAQSSSTSGKLPDWTGLTANDAQTATITASDGRKYVTADGGKTWQLQ